MSENRTVNFDEWKQQLTINNWVKTEQLTMMRENRTVNNDEWKQKWQGADNHSN